MNFKVWLTIVIGFGSAFASSAQSTFSQPQDRITTAVNLTSVVMVPNSVHPAVLSAVSSHVVDPSFAMEHMILTLAPSESQQAALELLLTQQQDHTSPNFHKFLTPAQYAASFGASQNDLSKVTGWLQSNGFQIDEVAANNLAIVFSGNASQVAATFKTEIRQYLVNGEVHHANATAPQIPAALSRVVQGALKLHDFHSKSPAVKLTPLYTSGSSAHYMVPADFAVIYNLNPLFGNGFTGAAQNIAVIGRSNVNPTDLATFRLNYGLPASNVTPIYATGTDPGIATNGDALEATLDVEWAGAVAPRANVKLVMAASTSASDGIDLAAQYAINHNVASILSVSFGACEASVNNSFYNSLWQQAAAQGISVFVAAGDSGASGCDGSSEVIGSLKSVNGICSSPYSTCVGGTMFDDTANPGQYWLASNNAVMGSAISYIPEHVWNESTLTTGGAGLAAGGGGVSGVYLKPYWQSAPGVPADGHRDVPDLSLSAAQHDGYMMFYGGVPAAASGTSAATPSFAGIMALVTQKYGAAQGVINQVLYPLAARGTQAGSMPIFHDITSGNNSVPGIQGYSAAPGYDLASGLGSVDATQLANHWADLTGGFSLTASAASVTVLPGQNGTVTLNVTDLGTFHAQVSMALSSLPAGIIANFTPGTLTGSGSSVLTFAAMGTATSGTYPITVTATGGGITRTASFNLVVVVSTNCTLSALPASLNVVQSQATSTRLVCGNAQGVFASSLLLSVTGAPAGMTTSLSPSLLTAGTGVSTLVVNATSGVTAGTYALVVTAVLPNANPAFTQTLGITVNVNAPTTFTVTPSVSSVSIQQGSAGTVVLTSAHSGAFNNFVSFSTSGLPTSVTASLSATVIPAPGDGVTTITLQPSSASAPGTYTMMVLAQGGGLSVRVPITVRVTAAPAYTLTASAAVLTLRRSTATTPGTVPITLTINNLTNNFNFPVAFSVSGLPAGVSAAFSAATISAPGSGSTVLTLTASATATTGVSTFTVTAAGGTITRAVNVQLILTSAPTFSIAVSVPNYNMLAGTTLTETITAKGLYGYNSNIQLATGTPPTGLGVSFQNTTINGLYGTTTMSIQAAATLAAGAYSITVTATDPVTSNTQTAVINLLVGNVTTSLGSSTLNIARGASASASITSVAVSYTGNVSLLMGALPQGVAYSFSRAVIAGSGTSTLTISALSSVRPGNYPVTVESVSSGIISNMPLMLIIN